MVVRPRKPKTRDPVERDKKRKDREVAGSSGTESLVREDRKRSQDRRKDGQDVEGQKPWTENE